MAEEKKTCVFYIKDIVDIIEAAVPLELQESWDNSGIQVGFKQRPVSRVLTCLEIDRRVLKEAIELDVDMIITHHPLIFSALKSLTDDDYKKGIIMELVENGISVYSCHTPFDKVRGGNNDIIAEKLGLTRIRNLAGEDVLSPEKMIAKAQEADIGRMGELKKAVTFKEFIQQTAVSLELSIRQLRASGPMDMEIKKVGICTGAGADLAMAAGSSGCQLFVTGDVKYHEALDAVSAGMCILDAGHYGTERFFAEAMKDLLVDKLGKNGKGIEIIVSEVCMEPFEIL